VRIAQVTATFPPYMAGTGNVCYHNALGLARLGHRVTVYTAAGQDAETFDPYGVEVRRLRAAVRYGNAPLLPGLAGIRDVDIIHLHYPFIFGAELVSAIARIRRIPLVLTYHNDLIGEGIRRYLFAAYSMMTDGLVLGGARKLGVLSEDHARSSLRAALFRRRWKDVVEIPNGVDADLFRPLPGGEAVRRKLGLGADDRLVAFVGTLDRAHYFKGVSTLLEAFSLIKCSNAKLLIIGGGEWTPRYERQAQHCGIGGRTFFTGAIPFPELPEYYNAADVVVLPSLAVESFGIVLIEAMACRKPVIASDLPGVRSVVVDSQDGFLVPPNDPAALAFRIQQLIDDPQLRDKMGALGRAKIEDRYAWPKIIPRLVRMYEEALGSGVASGGLGKKPTEGSDGL
jgi:glycosyltransferase involved in cell wall biosynthesis